MKKFSKIFESKQFHTWNVDMIKNKMEEIPNSRVVNIDILYSYRTKEGDEIVESDDKYLHDDSLVQPLFIVLIEYKFNIKDSYFMDENDKQSDSWVGELLNWKIYSNWIQNISKVLENFEDDFYVFIHTDSLNFEDLLKSNKIEIQFELSMKDKFDKEIMD